MKNNEELETIVESSFQDENVSTKEIVNYITQFDVFFGICEESDDLEELRKSYELQ